MSEQAPAELKPCPHCGSPATWNESMGEVWISCTADCQKMEDSAFSDRCEKAWNTRADSKLVEALIEIAAADNLKAWKLREIADKAVQEYEEKTKCGN